MASKYRIGTTIGVTMNISNMPSETANMFVRSEYGTFDMVNVTVLKDGGNPIGISGKFEAANQKYIGKYDVIVVSSTKRLCVDNAFELVKHSDEADTGISTEITFDVSYLTCPTVVSGYEEWRQSHDGTIEDYWMWIRDEERLEKIEKDLTDVDAKHSNGKIFCNGILEYGKEPTKDGYYLQKDVDGDIACLTYYNSSSLEKTFEDAPTDKIFVVKDRLFVRKLFKIVPVGYKEVILNVSTPMEYIGDVDYVMECNIANNPSKVIQLTSIK